MHHVRSLVNTAFTTRCCTAETKPCSHAVHVAMAVIIRGDSFSSCRNSLTRLYLEAYNANTVLTMLLFSASTTTVRCRAFAEG